MLTTEQKQQFSDILEELGKTLDITETQYETAVKSYEAVGNWLAKEDSTLALYSPEILPQGSFMLGTMVKPINDKDDLDIDLVCQLKGKNPEWTQKDLKHKVGDRLKAHGTYKEMLDHEGRRCWTLVYSNDANYHMDILPSIVDKGYRMILEKAFSDTELKDIEKLSLRITDNQTDNYDWETNHLEWLKSNPFGYGRWFFQQATLDVQKAFSLNESIALIPKYKKEKLPLQRVVQILKRHRDMLFNGDEHKPISIIITTLASKAYNKETDIIEALINVVNNMENYIEERWSDEHDKRIKWISNPVNDEENFADKWQEYPQREKNFYIWLNEVKKDLNNILGQSGKGLQYINESMQKPFGKDAVTKAFNNYGENLRKRREDGNLNVAAKTGMIGAAGTIVKNHNFYGKKEE
ncbi:MAG: nucleotidyltransferase [Chitinophagaceae bacterium]|nr:nucleotidyltransferase [Chitinophagaceae bacterium]